MMQISKSSRRADAIENGLKYLELQLDTKSVPFTSDCFGTSRDDLTSTQLPHPVIDIYDTYNMYMLLLLLEPHLPTKFRSKLIEKMRPKRIEPLNYFGHFGDECKRLPNDLDTTAVFYLGLMKANCLTETELVPLALSLYENVNDDGVLHSYITTKEHPRYNRVDAVCTISIVRFAYALRHEHLIRSTEDGVFNWLNSGNYKSGTLYYPSPYTFLYFCSQLASTNYHTKARYMDILRREFNQIDHGDLKYPLDYALTILTGLELGIRNEHLIDKLMDMQNKDGSWPVDAFYATNHVKIHFGSKSISTMFAVLALMESV